MSTSSRTVPMGAPVCTEGAQKPVIVDDRYDPPEGSASARPRSWWTPQPSRPAQTGTGASCGLERTLDRLLVSHQPRHLRHHRAVDHLSDAGLSESGDSARLVVKLTVCRRAILGHRPARYRAGQSAAAITAQPLSTLILPGYTRPGQVQRCPTRGRAPSRSRLRP